MLPLDYHLWNCIVPEGPVTQTPPFFDLETPVVATMNFYSLAGPEHPGTKLLPEPHRKKMLLPCSILLRLAGQEFR